MTESSVVRYKPIECNWRPWPLRTPLLGAFSALCIVICICIELIVHGCSSTGCRIFGAPSTVKVSPLADFLYNFLPTILSVLFGLLWAVVHHDVMRLEPYIQMSKKGGAAAKDSILLDYSYMFPLSTPYWALKRGHYVVFLSTCILLFTTFLVAPLISGLFDDAHLQKHINSTAPREVIKPGDAQYSSTFGYMAYDYHWGSGMLPRFTTPTYALLPVRPGSAVIGDNETWSAETKLFEADLECEPAVITPITHWGLGMIGFNITSLSDSRLKSYLWDTSIVHNNNITHVYTTPDPESNPKLLNDSSFVTHWTSAVRPSRLSLDNHLFLWGSAAPLSTEGLPGLPRNLTAVYCTASYHSQSVIANFSMPSGNITAVDRIGVRTPFTNSVGFMSIFNGSFKFKGYSSAAEENITSSFRPITLPNVDSKLRKEFGLRDASLEKFISGPAGVYSNSSVLMNVFTLPAFSLHNYTNKTLVELLDPQVLSETYERELKLLFALAVVVELVDRNSTEPVTVLRVVYTRGFTVRGLWARGAQGGLIVVAIMTVILGVLNHHRPCKLDGEPNSIGAALQLLALSPELCADFENAEYYTQEKLHVILHQRGRRYELVFMEWYGPRIHVHCETPPVDKPERCIKPRLWARRTSSWVGLLTFFGLITMLLLAVFAYARTHNGLPALGGANSFRYKLLFSYIPFIIGSAVDPALATLGSYYCMLGPYKALNKHYSLRGNPLAIDYDKSPPNFQVLRALRTGDFTLASLTVSILLANVVSVVLGSLFSLMSPEFTINADIMNLGPPTVTGTFIDPTIDMFYMFAANMMDGTNVLSWTTPDYYVVPFSSASLGVLQAPTVGIGVDIKCNKLPDDHLVPVCIDNNNGTKKVVECTSGDSWAHGVNINDSCLVNGTNSEYTGLIRFDKDEIFLSPACHNTFFAVLVGLANIANCGPLNVVLKCEATERVHKITASINEGKQVLSTITIPPDDEKIETIYSTNKSIDKLTSGFLKGILASQTSVFNPLGWFLVLTGILKPSIFQRVTNNSWCITDPTQIVAPFEQVYRRLFAINLKLYEEDIFSFGTSYNSSGKATVTREKVNMNSAMTIVALIILLYMTVVLVVFYLWERPRYLHHAPESLAGMYSLLYASNTKSQTLGTTPEERTERLDGRYYFGDFIGEDGKTHVGVYRENEAALSPPE